MHEKMRNTEIRELANVETVESMIRRRRLRWLGHMARMPQSRMVYWREGGKCAAGVQKLQWNDIVARNVKKCEMCSEWRSVAKDWREWRGKVAAAVEDFNKEAEKQEKHRKDERKRRREEAAVTGDMWPCSLSGCVSAGKLPLSTGSYAYSRSCTSLFSDIFFLLPTSSASGS